MNTQKKLRTGGLPLPIYKTDFSVGRFQKELALNSNSFFVVNSTQIEVYARLVVSKAYDLLSCKVE